MKFSPKAAAALVALGLVGIASASGVAYWRMRPQPLPAQLIYGSGRIEADEVRIAPEVPGRVVENRAVEGQSVRAGETLARIDPADYTLLADRAEAQRVAALRTAAQIDAQIGLAAHHARTARTDLARYESLGQQGWIPAQRLDVARNSYAAASDQVSHRAWFSPEEYKRLYQASRDRAKNPKKERWRTAAENLHDYILFMVNTGLRPDEVLGLEYRDVAIVTDDATGERILEIKVRGKRGVGYCKSMPGAVMPFRRLKDRNKGQPTDRLFPSFQRELFNTLLQELGLREDREGQRRTAYSLRHTYICLRLMEGADIYQVAKNCRTSVEMIQAFYASHIASTLDASAINVRKPKPAKRPARQEAADAA